MRKSLILLLIGLMILLPLLDEVTNAASYVENDSGDSMQFVSTGATAGDFKIVISGHTGSAIRYKTTSWIVRLGTVCNDSNLAPDDRTNSICDSTKGGESSSKWAQLKMCKSNESPAVITDALTATAAQLSTCDAKGVDVLKVGDPTTTISTFNFNRERIRAKFLKTVDLATIKELTPLYFSAQFTTIINGTEGTYDQYKTLAAIRGAQSWSTTTLKVLREYYDRMTPYYPTPDKLEVEKLSTTNLPLQSPNPIQFPNATTLYKASAYTVDVPVTGTLDYPATGGVHYVLACSYQYRKAAPPANKTDCSSISAGSPNYKIEGPYTRKPPMAIGGMVVAMIYKTTDCKCMVEPLIINPQDISGMVTTDKLLKTVPLTADFRGSTPELTNWTEYMQGATKIEIKVSPSRSDIAGNNNNGSVVIWSNDYTYTPDTWTNSNAPDILALIGGTKSITYTDDLTNYPIAEGQSIAFSYGLSVQIRVTKSGVEVTKTCSATVTSQSVSFFRPDPELGTYTSYPSYWSEIKDTAPDSETFEAMAGIPSTRSLYFASGGSEYIVDVETERVPGVTSTRTYQSNFSSATSEFIDLDKAGSYSVPAPNGAASSSITINAHNGGSVTATWTGPVPLLTSRTWRDHEANGSDTWSESAWTTANDQADAWVTAVNSKVITFKAGSDGITRSFSNWGASKSGSETHPPSSVTIGHPFKAAEIGTCGIAPNTSPCETSPKIDYQATTGTSASSGTYTITVTGKIDARIIDGPSSIYTLPAIQDTWTQTIKYDYMKIKKAKVWKLDKSAVNGMTDLTGTEEFKASIVQGDPNMFVNIATSNDSVGGRLRYTLDTNQHDTVVYNNGARTREDDGNGCNGWICGPGQGAAWADGIIYNNGSYPNIKDYEVTNSTADDKLTHEYDVFKGQREALNTVTVVSDMLILQTSSGDQSIMYFDKSPPVKQSQENYADVVASKEDMWDNNPLSFANKSEDAINIGSYNGNYSQPNAKWSTRTYSNVSTIFDTLPAGKIRPTRTGSPMLLVKTGIDLIDTTPNGHYATGTSKVFYKNVLNYGPGADKYPIMYNSTFSDTGAEFTSAYSPSHTKVNDIVIHDPVSTEGSMVYSLPNSMDQRTTASKALGGKLDSGVVEYEKVLDPAWRPNLLTNGDAESIGSTGLINGWSSTSSYPASNVSFTKRQLDNWVMAGLTSFEIATTPQTGSSPQYTGSYYKESTAYPSTEYDLTGILSCHRCVGSFKVDEYNSSGVIVATKSSTTVVNTGALNPRSINFTTTPTTAKVRVSLVKGNTSGSNGVTNDNLFADSLVLHNTNSATQMPDPSYSTVSAPNPDYVPATSSNSAIFNWTGGTQRYYVPVSGAYTIEAWGAQGGGNDPSGSNGSKGGYGGYSKGTINLNKSEPLYFYVGAQGSWSSANGQGGGFNGGGNGGPGGYGGGGATDVRRGITTGYWTVDGGAVAAWNGAATQAGGPPGNIVYTTANMQGIHGPYTTVTPGRYQITVWGENLQIGDPYTAYNYALQYNFPISGVYKSSNIASFYVDVTSAQTTMEWIWAQTGAGYMKIFSTEMSRLDSRILVAGGGGGSDDAGADPVGGSNDGSGGSGGGTSGEPAYIEGSQSYQSEGNQGSGYGLGLGESSTVAPFPIQAWDFTSSLNGFLNGSSTLTLPGPMRGSINNSDSNFLSPDNLDISLDGTEQIEIKVKNNSTGTGAQIYFTTTASTGFAEDKVRQFTMSSNDTGYKVYRIPMSGTNWGGTLKQLRFDLANWTTTGSYDVSYIRIVGGATPTDTGGGGGGYYGGKATNHYNGGGGGGSGYVGGLSNASTSISTRKGMGYATITGPGSPAVGSPTIDIVTMSDPGLLGIPASAYNLITKATDPSAPVNIGGTSFTPGNFVVSDNSFSINYPNTGNFYGNGAWGISTTTNTRGKGFVDDMDTLTWIKSKSVRFQFAVIYNGAMYREDTWIDLAKAPTTYTFSIPLAQSEKSSALVEFRTIAINGAEDGLAETNAIRYDYPISNAAKHSAYKRAFVDVVGRIGNFIITDTQDYRFSNLFKNAVSPTKWYIPNVVKVVDSASQYKIVGDTYNIRGELAGNSTNYLNTYGNVPSSDSLPISLPLSPEKNNIVALQKQPMRLGYNLFASIQTTGDYYDTLQIIPYYYVMDLLTGALDSVDVYMETKGSPELINKFNIVQTGWDPTTIFENIVAINWDSEYKRRAVSSNEISSTSSALTAIRGTNTLTDGGKGDSPYGGYYPYGTSQVQYVDGRGRSYIGSSITNGTVNNNPGNVITEAEFTQKAQRWHFTLGLPSSATWVKSGLAYNKANIEAMSGNTKILIMSADIKALGDTYALQYAIPGGNKPIVLSGVSRATTSIPYPVIAVYSTTKSSADDLSITGTH